MAALAIFTLIGVTEAQSDAQDVRNATWQTSVNDDEAGTVQLGVRDKWSSLGKYRVQFVVTRGKRAFRSRSAGSGDGWAFVSFPRDFGAAAATSEGPFSIAFYGNGILVGRDRFDLRR